jgi:uncharacterized protein
MPSNRTAPRLIIRSSAIHAAGCYTLDPIRRGQRITEYNGPRLSKTAADERYADRIVTYLFAVGGENDVIDGFGTPMFINHSCAPNCETVERDERIFITAIRDIAADEELLYEYHLCDSDDDNADCYCGAPKCRGTMFSDEEVKRRAKLAKRRAAREKTAR